MVLKGNNFALIPNFRVSRDLCSRLWPGDCVQLRWLRSPHMSWVTSQTLQLGKQTYRESLFFFSGCSVNCFTSEPWLNAENMGIKKKAGVGGGGFCIPSDNSPQAVLVLDETACAKI